MKDIQDRDLYTDETVFQGSEGNLTWTTIFTMDENVHEGWNYKIWDAPADYPKYRFYRFYGTKIGSCRFTEIKLQGIETVNIDTADTTCTPVYID
jgi:hypothetical protein